MGIGDWGLGIGDWGLGPIPNPKSPIPNPQSPMNNYFINFFKIKFLLNYKKLISIIKILLTIYKINSTNIYHQKKIINF